MVISTRTDLNHVRYKTFLQTLITTSCIPLQPLVDAKSIVSIYRRRCFTACAVCKAETFADKQLPILKALQVV